MLRPGLKKKKSKESAQIDPLLQKGLLLLQDKLYKQAVIELKVALENRPDLVIPELERLYDTYEEERETEKALAVGQVLLPVKKSSSLANRLGNYSRKLGDYDQANILYRQALKLDSSNNTAFFNLAASMGRVAKYDDEVKECIRRYFTIRDFIIPEYLDDPDFEHNIRLLAENRKLEEKNRRMREFDMLRDDKVAIDQKLENPDLEKNLQSVIRRNVSVKTEDILKALASEEEKMEEALADPPAGDSLKQYNQFLFNSGLYALKNSWVVEALEWFIKLKSNPVEIRNLDLCLALATEFNGQRSEAIRLMQEAANEDLDNRLININLAILYQKNRNRLQSLKYQAISASLLEKSEGLCYLSEISQQANLYFKQGKLEPARKLFRIIAADSKDINAWLRIGDIHLENKRYAEAVHAYKEIEKYEPDSRVVQEKLLEVHNYYKEKADSLYSDHKFSQAAVVYERAAKLVRQPDTLDQLINVYRKLNRNDLVQELYTEKQLLVEKEREKAEEEKRQQLVSKGQQLLKNRNFEAAISMFEEAFSIRADKDVFAYLAHIYKGLNRKRYLEDLMERWRVIKEAEERRRISEANSPHSNPDTDIRRPVRP